MTALEEAAPTERLIPIPQPADIQWPGTVAQPASAHPALRRLAGWCWEYWEVPGVAGECTLVGHVVVDDVLVMLFVETEDAARARWRPLGGDRETQVAQGSVSEVVTRIVAGLP